MLRIFKQNYPVRNVFFVVGEFCAIYLSGLIVSIFVYGGDFFAEEPWLLLKILLITFVSQACLYYNDLYDLNVTDNFSELGIRLLQSLGATAIFLAGVYALIPPASVGLKVFVMTIGCCIVLIASWRFGYTLILNRRMFDRKVTILGSGPFGRDIIREINFRRDCGYVVSCVVLEGREEDDERMRKVVDYFRCDCNFDTRIISAEECVELSDKVSALDIQTIVVALQQQGNLPVKELLKCRVNGIEVIDGNSFYEMLTGKLLVDYIRPGWLIFSEGFHKSKLRRLIKRSVDLILSLLMLAVLWPLILIVAVLIKLDTKEPEPDPVDIWRYFSRICAREGCSSASMTLRLISGQLSPSEAMRQPAVIWQRFRERCVEEKTPISDRILELIKVYINEKEPDGGPKRPVFFSQERMGLDGKPYKVHKFRSMIVNAERYSGPVWAGENDKRITRLGHFLRKTRIDEIPQLWNVLKGEMSFVGPRPEREHFVRQLEKTIPYYRERLTVKPGLTGWAQVCYRYGASEDDAKEKLNYDLFYIKNMSTLMDLMIILRTIKIVLFGMGR